MKNALLPLILFFLICATNMVSQMESTVNSLADDEFAHPKDFLLTPEDESIDGICEDSLHRCTLRAALEEASLIGTSARVVFSGTGTIVMDPLQGGFFPPDGSFVQGFGQNVSILGDGFNSPVIFAIGSNTLISGIHFTNALMGILIAGNGNRIGLSSPQEANYISDMAQNGIIITGDSNKITGNIIGLDLLGAAEGSPFGIFITGKENIIGGIHQGDGNVISGNDKGIGAYTIDSLGGYNYIVGNLIGTNISGTSAIGNKVGLDIIGPGLIIGGDTSVAMNVISGNTESGILLGIQASGIDIRGNHVGTDRSGTVLIPNRDGIILGPGSDQSIVWDNLVKGNTQFGIVITGLPDSALESSFHTIAGNDILMNNIAGIGITNNAHDNMIGESIFDVGESNNIQFNGQGGVVFSNSFATPENNTIRKNRFMQNGMKGINLTSNCGNCQNQIFPPDITGYVEVDPNSAAVNGTHSSVGAIIDVYSGNINLSGRYEGLEWLGSGVVNAEHNFIFFIDNCNCDIVATATDPDGNTSEFTDGEPIVTSVENHVKKNATLITYPNPFIDEINFDIHLTQSDLISLKVYTSDGIEIATIYNEFLLPGEYHHSWYPGSFSNGMYYYKLISESQSAQEGKIIRMGE